MMKGKVEKVEKEGREEENEEGRGMKKIRENA